tara:strand:- start:45 stop:311 length:267 start_codon:yes stop_codon:yes gene_type:complete
MKKKVKGEKTKATVKVKPKSKIRFVDRIDEQIEGVRIENVYDPSYKLIDDTIEEIKKTSRKVCSNDYATNNVYLFLQNCLKRIILAEK